MEVTFGDLLNFTLEENRAFARELIAFWQEGHQLDIEADHRAARRGTIDAPGPIDELGQYAYSGTNRAPS